MDDGRLLPCAECGGDGLLRFERGPAVEPCRACSGTGRTYTGERYRGVFAAMIVLCFAEVSSRYRDTGGPYLYARDAFGPVTGFAIGWLMWLARITAFATNTSIMLGYLGLFLLATHAFVVWYEEPTLTRLFGQEYRAYQTRVRRWLPRFSVRDSRSAAG